MDLIGKRFNRFVVIKPVWTVNKSGKKQKKWECLCDCGVVKFHLTYDLLSDKVKSCGCYNKEVATNRMSGENNFSWKGGRGTISKMGYIVLKHGENRGELEHRVLYEKYHGIKLTQKQNIHHKNGIKTDNRIENLELWDTSQPYGQRVEDKLNYYFNLIKIYYKIPLYSKIINEQLNDLVYSK